jgi:hypothetical protein
MFLKRITMSVLHDSQIHSMLHRLEESKSDRLRYIAFFIQQPNTRHDPFISLPQLSNYPEMARSTS